MNMDIENKIKKFKEIALNIDEVYELEQVKLIYGENDSSRKLAEIYLLSLDNLSFFQKEKTKLKEIADEAKKVYEQFKASEIVTEHYLSVLENLLYVKERKLEKETEIEAKRVYSQNKVSEKIAISYLSFLGTLAFVRKEKYELNKIIDDVTDLFNLHQGSKYIAQRCVDTLIGIVDFVIRDSEVAYIAEAMMGIFQMHPKLISMFDNYIDRLTVFGDSTKESLSKKTEILKTFIQKCDNENLIDRSKYSFIFESYGVLSDDDVKRLLEIFFLVQMIKAKLIVKDFEKLKFGHYTNGKVLQIHLKPNIKENENYKITSKSRLNNVNYMNDPSEGKVLDQFLELDSTLLDSSLKPSPWFLMSLTTAIDRLAMWSQYGAQAEGVCLVLNSSDFLEGKYTTGSYMFKGDSKRTSSDSNKELSPLEKLYKKKRNKDYIYRIGYLSIPGESEEILKPEFNSCFGETEVAEINIVLKEMKGKIKQIDKVTESILYEKIDDCLEEIRYLFKLADYSYESELRVLKYMPLDPNNPKIKIDDSGEIAKIYIERDNPINIAEVIFGPKFSHPENVTPLLQLLDKNIKFSQSKIPFK